MILGVKSFFAFTPVPTTRSETYIPQIDPLAPEVIGNYNSTPAVLVSKGLAAGVRGTALRALVTGYFQPLIAVVLLMSHSPSPLASLPFPSAGQG